MQQEDHTKRQKDDQPSANSSVGFLSVLQSVLAAMFGVQSEKKRQQDFTNGNAADYIFVGIVMVIIFVLSIVWYVNSVIADYNAATL